MSNFPRQSKSFISIFFICQVSACELRPFSCYNLANDIYSQTAKTVFSHLKDLGILKFNDIHLLQLGQFMYSCKNSFLPPNFNNKFSQSNQFHSYNTRNSQAYRLPYCRTNTKKFSPFFQGPKFFNSLDNKVINSQSLSSFKKKLKIALLSKYENSL